MDLRGWGVRVVAVAVMSVVALTGCGEDTGPVVTPTPTPTETVVESPSPTPSPTPTELTEEEVLAAIPESARTEDFGGAQAFAEFFMIESQRSYSTADLSLLRALSTEDCVFCTNTFEAIEAMTKDGVIATGGELAPNDASVQGGLQEDGDWRIVFAASIAERAFIDADGVTSDSTPAQEVSVTVVVTRHDDAWRVVDVASRDL